MNKYIFHTTQNHEEKITLLLSDKINLFPLNSGVFMSNKSNNSSYIKILKAKNLVWVLGFSGYK